LAHVVASVRKILAGHLVVSDRVATQLLGQALGHTAAAREAREFQMLSDRELQVLQMLSQGLHNKDIAQRLGLSSKTVGTYKARLMEKLGVSTAPELQRLAQQQLTNGDSSNSAKES
jgi:DNA-binding NarL/FixJ family response regulator